MEEINKGERRERQIWNILTEKAEKDRLEINE
jgi:hypothetical protein